MDYFLITQDQRIVNRVEPVGTTPLIQDSHDETTPVQLEIKAKDSVEYVDFIERPVPLLSDRLKQLLKLYEPEMAFYPVILTDSRHCSQTLYWKPNLPKLECLSSQAEFHKNGTIKQLVVNESQLSGWRLFQVDQVLEPFIVFDLMIVESMLRRGLTGFKLTRIALER